MRIRPTLLATLLLAACVQARTPQIPPTHVPAQTAHTAATHKNRESYTATVTSVHDGDTVRVTDSHGAQYRIRLANIDAPEINQAYGIASRDALRQKIDHQTVQITVYDTDRYRRQVARIMLNGEDINLAQIRNGNAWHYRSYAKKQQSTDEFAQYAQAEIQARSERAGLWAAREPIAPWLFRIWQREIQRTEKTDAQQPKTIAEPF